METLLDIQTLNLRDALLLYELIGKHIPKDIDENTDVLNFVGKIVRSIIEADEHKRYVDAIVLMTGKFVDEILSLSSEDAIMLFSEGLIKNHIILLSSFCEELGYGST